MSSAHPKRPDDARFRDRLTLIAKSFPGGIGRFAEALEVAETTLRKWRRGETEPQRPELVRMAQLAGVSLSWLILGEGSMNENALRLPRYTGQIDGGPTFEPGSVLSDRLLGSIGDADSADLFEWFVDAPGQGPLFPAGTWIIARRTERISAPPDGTYLMHHEGGAAHATVVRQLASLGRGTYELRIPGEVPSSAHYRWITELGGLVSRETTQDFCYPLGAVLWSGAPH